MPEKGPETETVLLFGATGYVGARLAVELGTALEVIGVRRRSPPAGPIRRWEICPATPAGIEELVLRIAPRYVVNAAAEAVIESCESDPDRAHRLNVELPAALARAASILGARLVHLSTDQVFDGTRGPYREEDPPNPISAYGLSKLGGEERILSSDADAVVLRLNLVYGPSPGPRGGSTGDLVERARAGEEIRLFTDEFRSPVHVGDAARALREILSGRHRGILHLGGPDRLSRFDLGAAILERHGLRDRAVATRLEEYEGPPRAPDTSFDSSLARGLLRSPPGSIRLPLDR